MHPAGRRDRQHGAGKPCTTPGLRAETALAPQDRRPDGTFGHIVGGFDPGDIQVGPERRLQVVDAFAHPSHPDVSRPDALGQDLAEPGLRPACPVLLGLQGCPGPCPTRRARKPVQAVFGEAAMDHRQSGHLVRHEFRRSRCLWQVGRRRPG